MIRVGTAGWSYADWEGVVYPRKKPRGFHPLAFLARSFSCVELNSSFYGVPHADHARRWLREVEPWPAFRFTAKLQDVFTHHPLPVDDEELQGLAAAWLEGVEPLRAAGRLGAVLVQFPFGFRRSRPAEERLERLRDAFGHLPLVLELRHRSWFVGGALRRLEALRYGLAAIDLPAHADHPPPEAPILGRVGYLRLHGRNAASWFDPRAGRDQRYDYLYGEEELVPLVERVRRIARAADETYVITNNHFSGQAPANALEILAELGPERPRAPAELVERFPRLRPRVRVDGQPSLF